MAVATSSIVLEPAAKELTRQTANHPFLFELGPEEGRKALDDLQSAKGRYVRTVTLTSTMGPGLHVDPAQTRGIVEELEEEAAVATPA